MCNLLELKKHPLLFSKVAKELSYFFYYEQYYAKGETKSPSPCLSPCHVKNLRPVV